MSQGPFTAFMEGPHAKGEVPRQVKYEKNHHPRDKVSASTEVHYKLSQIKENMLRSSQPRFNSYSNILIILKEKVI